MHGPLHNFERLHILFNTFINQYLLLLRQFSMLRYVYFVISKSFPLEHVVEADLADVM